MSLIQPGFNRQTQDVLLKNTLKLLPVSWLIAALLSMQLAYKKVPLTVIFSWLGFISVVVMIRLMHCQKVLANQRSTIIPSNNVVVFLSLTALMGGAWSSAWFVFQPYVNQLDEFIVLFAIASIATGGLASLSIFYPAFCVYTLSMLAPITIYFFSLPSMENMVWFIIISIYMVLLLYVARVVSDLLSNNARLTKEKDGLIGALKNSNNNLVQSLKEIEMLSITDSLTGIYNRRYFDKSLKKELARATRGHYQVSLILLDVDNFKMVNDKYGHPRGDQFIKHVAKMLSDHYRRANDLVFRIGGDEFAVISINMDGEKSLAYCKDFKQMFDENNEYIHTSLSIGLVTFDQNFQQNYQDLITEVDKALYSAKEKGKNQVVSKVLYEQLSLS